MEAGLAWSGRECSEYFGLHFETSHDSVPGDVCGVKGMCGKASK